MADDMKDILAGIRKSYQKSNIVDLDLESVVANTKEARLGLTLSRMNPLSSREYTLNFDPLETAFLDRLVNEETLSHRVILEKKDFFRGIVALDYFCAIIANNWDVLDSMYSLAEELEKLDKSLDPDMKMAANQMAIHHLFQTKQNLTKTEGWQRRRYNQRNQDNHLEYANLRQASPIYESLGHKVFGLIKDETIRSELEKMTGLYDIKAAVFTDAMLDMVEDKEKKAAVIDTFRRKDYFMTSLEAMNAVAEESSRFKLKEYIRGLIK